MEFFVIGLSHKTAPIEVRERLAFSGDRLELALSGLKRLPGVVDVVLLSTCNRTEVYGLAGDPAAGAAEVADWMGERSASDLGPSLYRKTGNNALRHLFRVASSLESMVVGEPQILGQVKQAFSEAQRARAAGPRIERIFSRAFQIAKKVRSQTGIAENAVSMSYVAVELARKIFGSLDGKAVMLIGAGEMSELAATHLQGAGCERVVVSNRSLERGAALAARFGGEARPLAEVPRLLEEVDIVVSSTAAPGFVVDREITAKALRARRFRPLFLIDLALPRDIDPAVNSLSNVYAYDVDDMEKVVQENLSRREEEAALGDRLVRQELSRFLDEEGTRAVQPVLAALRHTAQELAAAELGKTLGRLDGALDPRQRASVEAMAQAIVKKLLHAPTTYLRTAASSNEGERMAAALTTLFSLDVEGVQQKIEAEKLARRAAKGQGEASDEGAQVYTLPRADRGRE